MDKFRLTITLVAEGGELTEKARVELRQRMAEVLNFNLDPTPHMSKRPTGSIYWEGKEEKLSYDSSNTIVIDCQVSSTQSGRNRISWASLRSRWTPP